jgi:hypothetical protein
VRILSFGGVTWVCRALGQTACIGCGIEGLMKGNKAAVWLHRQLYWLVVARHFLMRIRFIKRVL